MKPEYFIEKSREEVLEVSRKNPHLSFLALGIPNDSRGQTWVAGIIVNGQEVATMVLPHEAIDAYIYSLGDIKQKLELERMKHA